MDRKNPVLCLNFNRIGADLHALYAILIFRIQ